MTESYFGSHGPEYEFVPAVTGDGGNPLPQHIEEGYDDFANSLGEELRATGEPTVDDAQVEQPGATGEETPTA